jgi:hypothetical protein
MGSFLDNLKKDLDTGEFNSEAAKKIIEIDKLAETKTAAESEEALNKRLEVVGVKVLKEEDVETLNSEYEEKMAKIKKTDDAYKQLADLADKEEQIMTAITDMITLANELKDEFAAEFEAKDPAFSDLLAKINHINMKYNNSVILNN